MPRMKKMDAARRVAETTIGTVRALKWAGNHAADVGSFDTVDYFLAGDHPLEEKREAVVVSQVTGMGISEEESPVTDEAVAESVQLARERLGL